MKEGMIVWLTGLPASGKTTVARLTAEMLRAEGHKTEILDADEILTSLADPYHILYISRLLSKNGVIVLIAGVCLPHVGDGEKNLSERVLNVRLRCPLEICMMRDSKGSYKEGLIAGTAELEESSKKSNSMELILNTEKYSPLECAHFLIRTIRNNGSLKRNLNEFRIYGMRRSGHHGVIAWLLRHFDGETYYYNNVSAYRDHFVISGKKDDKSYNVGSSDIRECYIFNVEDAALSGVTANISSDEWLTDAGPSDKIHDILVLRDPYNLLASRIKMFNEDVSTRIETLRLWREYAREFIGLTSYLPVDTIKVAYNAWHSSKEYRLMLSQRMRLKFNDRGAEDMIVPSSFDKDKKPRNMDVLVRWRHYAQDPGYRDLFILDHETNALAEAVFGESARAILSELKDGPKGSV